MSPGSCISHFEIIEKVGEGGMGVVYKARDIRLGRYVAIKVLGDQASISRERQAWFEREAKAASALNHAHITIVHEIDTVEGATFIVMEFVDGRTLAQVIARKRLKLPEVINYGAQIADALAAAHAIGVIHRDLKPANIMITAKGQIKVLDFGLAKLTHPVTASPTESDTTVTMQTDIGLIVGTAPYMSPEQARARAVDARSDIFSFGVVLYEMLTGRRPFAGDTKASTLNAIVQDEPVAVKESVPGLPQEMDRIITRCLRKAPERRFQTMADLHVTLLELKEEWDTGRIESAKSSERPRTRSLWWAGAAGLLALSLALWQVKRSAAPAHSVVLPVTTYTGFQSDPCFSPDGSQIAFSWDGEKGGNFDIYVKMLGDTNALRLTRDPADDRYPAWSPDGKRIAFVRLGQNGGIYQTSALGGSERKLLDVRASGLTWFPDGKYLAFAGRIGEPKGIFILPAEGGEPRLISTPQDDVFDLAPAVSADGRRLSYAGCSGAPTLYYCDLYVQDLDAARLPQGNPRRITTQTISRVTGLAWNHDGQSLLSDGSFGAYTLTYLWRLEVNRKHLPQRLELAGANALSPSIASKGNRIAFSRSLLDFDIWQYHDGAETRPLIVSSLQDRNPQFSPDGRKIVFESDRSGEDTEIWTSLADGTEVIQMTNRLGRHQGTPRWSPDGRWIAFDSQGEDGRQGIYVVDATGGRPRRITFERSNEAIPSWSRDGKWIYFRSDRSGRQQIWRMPFSGGPAEQITANGGDTAFESADGRAVFYTKAGSSPLFVQALPRGPEQQVLSYVASRAFVPVEDGIYYIGRLEEDRKYTLQFFRFSTHTSQPLSRVEGLLSFGLSVSPDRKNIIFTKSVLNGANLMTIEYSR